MPRLAGLLKPILIAALISGIADLVYASIHIASYYHMSPMQIFQSIPRGVLGPCYGIVVMVVMYTVVLPLSAAHGSGALPDGPRGPDGRISDHQIPFRTILAHLFIIGRVISAYARFLWPQQDTARPK